AEAGMITDSPAPGRGGTSQELAGLVRAGLCRGAMAIIAAFSPDVQTRIMTQSVLDYMNRLGRAAREASRITARATVAQKNNALLATARALDAARDSLLAANA